MNSRLTPLSAAALRDALVGQILYPTDASGRPGHLAEFFRADGHWELTGARLPRIGVWLLKGDQICVDQQGAMSCRRLYRDAHGALFAGAVDAVGPPGAGLVRIILKPAP